MVDVAQLVRVTDCGSEGRGFESHLPPIEQARRCRAIDIFLFFLALRSKSICWSKVIRTKEVVKQLLKFGKSPRIN